MARIEPLPTIEELKRKYYDGAPSIFIQLQHWFAAHPNHPTVFDISALGFSNWLKKHYTQQTTSKLFTGLNASL